jgi:CrcB protein
MNLLGIALAGAAGALARYGLSGLAHRWWGAGFPWGTLTVNLIGCLLLGLLAEMIRHTGWLSPEARTAIGIGFLGSFTTFSTFGVETYRAIEQGDWGVAALNVASNVVLGLIFVLAGTTLARLLVQTRGGV